MPKPNQRGSALLETALVLPVLLAILLGIVDFTRILHYSQLVTAAARAGAQLAAVSVDAASDPARIRETAASSVGLAGMTVLSRTFSRTSASGQNRYVQVSTEYRFRPMWPYPGLPNPLPLRGAAIMRLP